MPPQSSRNKNFFKQFLKVVNALAVPLTIAVVGWWLQKGYQEEAIRKDYVQLAVSVLQNPDTSGTRADLRDWAVQLLNENSSVKFSKKVQQQLTNGNISFSNGSELISREQLRTELYLSKLDPQIATMARKLIEEAKKIGIEVIISKGLMSNKELNDIYEQGRSKPGKIITYERTNLHTEGLAFDAYLIKNGKEVDEQIIWDSVGEIARRVGLIWGGDRKGEFKNNSHFELHKN